MRVGWIPVRASRAVASARLRTFEPIRMLRHEGLDAGIFDPDQGSSYDVVVFQKAYEARHLDQAERLRANGTRVIFDLCDNHWQSGGSSHEHTERVARLDQMVAIADLVTTSTPELAELIDSPAHVIDDALDPVVRTRIAGLASLIPHRTATRLLWFGNAGTTNPPYGLVDLLDLVPTLNSVTEGRTVSLTMITDVGAPLVQEISRAAQFRVRALRWRYATFGALASRHDVCVLPARSNPFTRGKTGNRAITALRCGLAVIAGDLPAYRRLEDCLSIEGWQLNLARYLDDPARAHRDAARGRATVEQRFGDPVIAGQWKAAIAGTVGTPT